MYSNCIFCHADLGANEVIEHFPVGHRLAFDGAKGRLWVVCRRCERWNLTPLEERWEAIEDCERAFRATTLRVSTDNIGLARLRDGTELVRVGKPLRPELAAWRYGDQFGRRRRQSFVRAGLGLTIGGGMLLGGPVVGAAVLAAVWVADRRRHGTPRMALNSLVAVISNADGASVRVTNAALPRIRLAWDSRTKRWSLEIPDAWQEIMTLEGTDAVRASALLMPAVNRFGGTTATTRAAVSLLERHGYPEGLFRAVAAEWDGTAMGYRDLPGDRVEFVANSPRGFLTRLDPAQRLALEMAAHEDMERLALEGELRELETAWRNAEEIAAIADNLHFEFGA
ncbi:MAG TPA: hypothetical protein VJW73_04255 [Gemmatimonadaceae bacterium]|nr:hypothetical protein [Gemmatimonadaceae bacterium]